MVSCEDAANESFVSSGDFGAARFLPADFRFVLVGGHDCIVPKRSCASKQSVCPGETVRLGGQRGGLLVSGRVNRYRFATCFPASRGRMIR
jgi:hypothetical protein